MTLCVKCEEREATPKCVTCGRCRAYMHRWGNESADRIVEHWRKLRLRESLVETFAVVKDDRVTYIKADELQTRRLMFASRLRRKAKAVVVSIKVAEAMRKRA